MNYLIMSGTDIRNLHPEVAEAFLGKAPLQSAQPHFVSRRELLEAYAAMQSSLFGTATIEHGKCDLCEQAEGASGVA